MLEAVASFAAIAVENARIMIRLNEMNQIISGEKEQVEKAALASSWLAEHDSLTGLSNRRFLERVLDENIRLATLENTSIAVFFVDLDDFKNVNDTRGHDAGDRVLVAVGARLALCLPGWGLRRSRRGRRVRRRGARHKEYRQRGSHRRQGRGVI